MHLDPVCTQAGLLLAEQLLQQWLQADPVAAARLQALEGAVIEVQVQPQQWRLRLQITADSIALAQAADEAGCGDSGPVDLSFVGQADALKKVLAGTHPDRADVCWGGSAELLTEVLDILGHADFSLERQFSRPLGDLLGPTLAAGIRSGNRWLQDSLESARFNLADYLQQELRLLPSRPALDEFALELAELKARLAPLTERVDQLAQQKDTAG